MREFAGFTLSFGLLLSGATAQQAGNSQPSSAVQATAQTPDTSSSDTVLRRYEAAYGHQNLDELLAVWPSLQDDKKQFKKIKDVFGSASISDVNVSLLTEETQTVAGGDLLLRCKRSEQYMRLQDTRDALADVVPGRTGIPVGKPVPTKSPVHKTAEIWLTLHKTGAVWIIASLSEKKPR